jgi:hypothetical protein
LWSKYSKMRLSFPFAMHYRYNDYTVRFGFVSIEYIHLSIIITIAPLLYVRFETRTAGVSYSYCVPEAFSKRWTTSEHTS